MGDRPPKNQESAANSESVVANRESARIDPPMNEPPKDAHIPPFDDPKGDLSEGALPADNEDYGLAGNPEPKSYSKDSRGADESFAARSRGPIVNPRDDADESPAREPRSSREDEARDSPKSNKTDDGHESPERKQEGSRSRSCSPRKEGYQRDHPSRVVSMDRINSPHGAVAERQERREGTAPHYNRDRFSPPCRSPRRYRPTNNRSKDYYSGGGGRRKMNSQSPSPHRKRRYDYTSKLDYQPRPRNEESTRQYRDNEPRKTPREQDDSYRHRGGFSGQNDRRRSFDNRRRPPPDSVAREAEGRSDKNRFGKNETWDRSRDYPEDRNGYNFKGGDRDYSTRWNRDKYDGYKGQQRGPRRDREFEPRRRLNEGLDDARAKIVSKGDSYPRENPRGKLSPDEEGLSREFELKKNGDRDFRREYSKDRDLDRESKRGYDKARRASPPVERRPPSVDGGEANHDVQQERVRDNDRERSVERDGRRGQGRKWGESSEDRNSPRNFDRRRTSDREYDRTGGDDARSKLQYNSRSMIRETSLERLRRREIEREFRLERANVKYKKVRRDEDRDISERIALGQAQATAQETLFDARLFNRDGDANAPNITTAEDDDYVLYDKPLFAARTRRPF